jgi:hypothetical protein
MIKYLVSGGLGKACSRPDAGKRQTTARQDKKIIEKKKRKGEKKTCREQQKGHLPSPALLPKGPA